MDCIITISATVRSPLSRRSRRTSKATANVSMIELDWLMTSMQKLGIPCIMTSKPWWREG